MSDRHADPEGTCATAEPEPVLPEPATVPQDPPVEPTGDHGVDRALRDLEDGLGSEDPDQQVAAVADAHRRLQARLSGPAQ